MPELLFKGKEFVYNHHLSVPFRPLIPDPAKSIGDASLDGNLIIHGDNLHALKALLPMYAGKVDCIFIDPPYNTGNEGWSYNDNVNSPMIKEWLAGNPVGLEDGLRHDKWCAMMWPRLRLLHELLSETGSLWMTIDDNEIAKIRLIMDEIWGEHNFVTTVIWHKVYSPKNTARHFSEDHDYLVVYAKNGELWEPNLLPRTQEMEARYSNPDNDPRGTWKSGDLTARNPYSKGRYEVVGPTGRAFTSGTRYWRQSYESFQVLNANNEVWWGPDGNNMPARKQFLSSVKAGLVPQTIWSYDEAGHTQDAKKELLAIMGFGEEDDVFITPKPVKLIDRIVRVASKPESIVLDSFAGSATTAHAVLAANARDGGKRKFILVECEDYADTLTAERVRRVINGYAFSGTQREELLRERITFTKLKQSELLLERVQEINDRDGHRFDRIAKTVDDGELVVTGEKRVEERTEGLGGSFTFCSIGPPIDLDALLTGDALPSFEALASVLFHMATNQAFDASAIDCDALALPGHGYLGPGPGHHVWLIYQPDLDFLKSADASLTLTKARDIAAYKPDQRHVVYAPSRFVSQKLLNDEAILVEFAPLPFALYRLQGS